MKKGCRLIFSTILFTLLFFLYPAARCQAVNWMMLQSSEKPGFPVYKPFGFILGDYQYTGDSRLPAGPWAGQKAVFNQIGPRLASPSQATLRKLRLGVRGRFDSTAVNYRLLALAGDNGVTRIDTGDRGRLLDVSLTLNRFPGTRLRLGMFKHPGAEEALQRNPPGRYVNLTSMTQQLLLERFFESDGSAPLDPNPPGAFSTFRDIGVMAFDCFRRQAWEHTYAVMLGNGHGISPDDGNPAGELYLYWSSEYVYGGKGRKQEGLKFFGWLQDGERTVRTGISRIREDFDRSRYGGGVTWFCRNFRGAVEVVKAEGMIPGGIDGGAVPGALSNDGTRIASFNLLPREEALGWYVDLGYRIRPALWLDLRYDRLDRGTEVQRHERRFTTLTLGCRYYFTPKLRCIVNYEIRDNEAPELGSDSPVNEILDTLDNRLGLQIMWTF